MPENVYVTKISGERELYNEEKLRRSLEKSGADRETVDRVAEHIRKELYDGMSTKKIYRHAFSLLRKKEPFLAARYNLRNAIFELGPTGFPFEQYVAELLRQEGYSVKTNQIVRGRCVSHEIDVIGEKGDEHCIVEAKYHGSQNLKTDVKVALYVQARFDDIRYRWEKEKNASSRKHEIHRAWIVTNTKFTTEAIAYGKCVNLVLIGWGYPKGNALQDMIERTGLAPVTVLTTLSKQKKGMLLREGIVLCRDVLYKKEVLRGFGFGGKKVRDVLEEARKVCATSP